jgi:lipopolysaccharide transport system ATP-binding protein
MNYALITLGWRMIDKEWQIAILGTFDVENYGDLLFPIIAEAELTKRLGAVKLHRFSYHAKAPPNWPYHVTSLTELPKIAGNLDGVLIGGGFIIRFDKEVAANYGPPTADIHHPTGYWLTPALIALQHGIPLMWNAPGMHCNEIPSWAHPLLKVALEHSSYISVRDELSQIALANFTDKKRIQILPDTAFGLSEIIDERHPSVEIDHLKESAGITGRYIVVQAANCLDSFLHLIKNNPQLFQGYKFVVLPIGPVLGDNEAILEDHLIGAICLPFWPQPKIIAELISQAEAVVGHSYHLAITALAFGVPVFSSADLSAGKYTALSDIETIFSLPAEIEPQWFVSRIGKRTPSSAANTVLHKLNRHWDGIADMLRQGTTATTTALNAFWQSLPTLLETAAETSSELALENKRYITELKTLQTDLDAAHMLHQQYESELRANLFEAQKSITELHNSSSMKITAPLRAMSRSFKYLMGKL